MDRGAVLFAILVVIVPLALLAGVWLLPAFGLLLALVGLFILTLGFTVGVGALSS